MTFREGWLERQLKTASTTVDSWSSAKREALTINRTSYSCTNQASISVSNATQNRTSSNGCTNSNS